MRSGLMTVLLAFLPFAPRPALADSLFQFTLTGDGYNFAFQAPNPPTITEEPHLIYVYASNVAGTVNGVVGYTFYAGFVTNPDFQSPTLDLSISPTPSSLAGTPSYDAPFALFGPAVTTLVSDVPNPNPQCYLGVCNDLLTFAFVPNTYNFDGINPATGLVRYTLAISAVTPVATTPEPAPLLLVSCGAFASAAWLSRKGAHRSV